MKSYLNAVALIIAYEFGILMSNHADDWWAWVIFVVAMFGCCELIDIYSRDYAERKYKNVS